MRFIIKEESAVENPIIELYLERGLSNIVLVGIDSDGKKKIIMSFREDGMFRRYINAELKGLQTDGEGRIVEEK